MSLIEKNTIHCIDCMDGLREMPDNYIDLAIVDPPYGIGEDGGKFRDRTGGGYRVHPKKSWDNYRPEAVYFSELLRVSRNSIVWGAIYFTDVLPVSRGWVYWDKKMGGDFGDGDMAWTSFNCVVRSFSFCNKYHGQIHPTQKPADLYKWLLQNYAKEGDLILDTHMGSGSSYIACLDMGFDYIGYEIDADYFTAIEKRVYDFTRQTNFFEV